MLALVSGEPHSSEVMLSVFGASAGLAGLVLVFVGLLITRIGTYPGGTSKAALRPYRVAAWSATGVFGVSLATVAVSLLWLTVTASHWLYVSTLVLFAALVGMLFVLAAAITKATV
jgi:hypothetical protein